MDKIELLEEFIKLGLSMMEDGDGYLCVVTHRSFMESYTFEFRSDDFYYLVKRCVKFAKTGDI